MNIRKAYHKWMSAFLAFTMMFSIIPVNVFQSTESVAYGATVIGGGGGITGTSSNGKWRANWLPNQHIVRAFGAIVHNLRKTYNNLFRSPKFGASIFLCIFPILTQLLK